ncbi:MAG: pilus assembly protein [Chloroflexi bacterium]|nr:pilus assembly protein [Chloroflexota bacterium]MCI0576204.1 pilus assembly protein [Chloroflexota bacterium]MCI0645502.1 pilus assembly protein [Chloroflexota bacterium]MCI0730641.1 pilus assembly protein [Chloroflexota bacterium]
MNRWQLFINKSRERGQSLVEVAILLPILILVLAGVVEVSNVLITQNRVTTAARTGAGFGAANYDPNDWAGTADGMGQVVFNTVTETLDLNPTLWDVWSIRARTNETGTGFEWFQYVHTNDGAVVATADEPAILAQAEADMLADLLSTGQDNAKSIEVVASLAYYNTDDVLGLPVWQWSGLYRLHDLTVMRVDGPAPFIGCSLLPISVRVNQDSVYPYLWPPGMAYVSGSPATTANIYPEAVNGPQEFEFPDPASQVSYLNNATPPQLNTNRFQYNVPGIELRYAQPGYIFWAREDTTSGNFGWLCWRPSCDANDAGASLDFPGDFLQMYPGSPADIGAYTIGPPYNDISGNSDGALERGEWVESMTGNVASLDNYMEEYATNPQQPITLVVFDAVDSGGANALYRLWDFVVVKLIGFSFQGNEKWIIFEFVSWGAPCIFEE